MGTLRLSCILAGALAGSPGCATPHGESAAAATPPSDSKGPAKENDAAKLKDKVRVAQLEIELQRAEAQAAAAKAHVELTIAQQRLETFDRAESPTRLAKARLELERAQDQLAEAEEELAELKMMYANADLADKTRDIVMHRTERRITRQKEALDLSAKELETLERATLPAERSRLDADVAARTADVENGQRHAAIDEMNKRSALRDAELELAKATAGAP